MDVRLSERSGRIEASGIRRMFELGRSLEDPVDFSIGQPDFSPPPGACEAAIAAVREGFSGYTVTQGIPELNRRLLQDVGAARRFRPESSLVTSGVSGGLLLAYLALLDPGDEILIPDPYFVMYRHLASLCGASANTYDLYPDFRLKVDRIEAALTDRTRFLLLNYPSNPTGAVAGERELRDLADLCRARDLFVVLDEIYERFVYDGPSLSLASYYPHVLLLTGFSKSFGMAGWRLGFACGPGDLIDKMRTLQQFTFVCAPSLVQRAGLAALDDDIGPTIDAYRRKRDLLWEGLREHFELERPGGAFYAFPRIPEGYGEPEFLEAAVAKQVLLVPGSACSERSTHFRISYAVSDEKIRRGVGVLVDLARAR